MRLGDLDEALRMIENSRSDNPFLRSITSPVWEAAHDCAITCVSACPTIDAVPVVQCKRVKEEILQRMDEFIAEYRSISESTVDHFGGKADAMDVAGRLVKAALTDLCSYGERKDGEG